MNLRCCDFEELKNRIRNNDSSIVMFGAGVIGRISVPEILNTYQLIENIDCYIDNNKTLWGNNIFVCGKNFLVHSPEYLKECNDNTIILINISRFHDVVEQLEGIECTQKMDCYITPMLLIHNYCFSESGGNANMHKKQLIPKKIHYMWLGGKQLPENLRKCIASWHKYCPDYEIIEWNENNYDISRHPYMRQAYDVGAYGFVPDYARLDILYNEGGIYLDTDVEIVKNIDSLLFQEAFCGVEKWQTVNFGGMSGALKGHPMIKKFLDARRDIYFMYPDGEQNNNTCGFYDTRVAISNGYDINGKTQSINGMTIYAYDYFHPYDYMSGILNRTPNTYSIHWFNGGWLDERMRKLNEISNREFYDLYKNAVAS